VKILQISSASSFGGGERHLVDLTNSLIDRGHDLYAVMRPQSPLLSHLRIPAGNIKALPLRNALDAQSARELAHFVKEHQIDVVHAHMARDYSLAAYATRRNSRTKFIVTRHVMFPLNRFHRRTLAQVGRIIAVSSAVAAQLRSQRLVNEDRITVVPNGVDVLRFAKARAEFSRFQFIQSKNLPVDCLLVGSIGELRTLKRHDDFIRAAAVVARTAPQSHFIIAGVDTSASGEVLKQLETLATQLGIAERVHFLGWLDNAEALLCAVDVFVSASQTESFGLSIAEAMATGTAVVATRTEGAQEVIDDQRTGLLVPIGDIDRLAESIATLLADENKRNLLGSQAREVVNERFSLNRMVDEIEKIYREGLGS
jgi:glycosyltransferase involved in cell wall biosynthesis